MSESRNYKSRNGQTWFRFSIRELMLAFVAISAIVALMVQNKRFAPTTFFETFDIKQSVQNVFDKLEWGIAEGAYGGGHKRNGRVVVFETDILIGIPDGETPSAFVGELRRNIESQIEQNGLDPMGSGSSGSELTNDLESFHFDYGKGSTRGDIYVWYYMRGDSHRLIVLMHEF